MESINLRDLERRLIARKRELGILGNDFMPLNDGTRRTESKRRLLQAVADNAPAQGRGPRFKARFAST